jgi:hypothetical protein
MDEVYIHVLRLRIIEKDTMDKLIAELEDAIRSRQRDVMAESDDRPGDFDDAVWSTTADWISGISDALGDVAFNESRKMTSGSDAQLLVHCAAEILDDLFIHAKERFQRRRRFDRQLKRQGF